MKTYSQAPDAAECVENMRERHHENLAGVTISTLFIFDDESAVMVLKHHGYWAGAVVRITPLKDRAIGMADASIIVDRAQWLTLSQRQRDALIDHELTHLARKVDKQTGELQCDALDRPALAMNKHDHHYGWFDVIAERHGAASMEVIQARRLVEATGQLYFDFDPPEGGKRERKVLERVDLNG